jgi:hypothetical protein
MTAKQAIKARCRDCLAEARVCEFTDCALKGLAKAKGKVKTSAIKAHYRWCLNGHLFSACNSPDCAIYQFRNEREGLKNTPNLPENRGYRGGYYPNKKTYSHTARPWRALQMPSLCRAYIKARGYV